MFAKTRKNVHVFHPRKSRPSEALEACIPFDDTFLTPDQLQSFMERTRPDVPVVVTLEPMDDEKKED